MTAGLFAIIGRNEDNEPGLVRKQSNQMPAKYSGVAIGRSAENEMYAYDNSRSYRGRNRQANNPDTIVLRPKGDTISRPGSSVQI
jgi:hypothetical protein